MEKNEEKNTEKIHNEKTSIPAQVTSLVNDI